MKNRVKEFRIKKGLSQTRLAEKVGTSLRNIQYLEKGDRGLDEWLERLAKELECQPYELIAPNEESVASFYQNLLSSIPSIEQASDFASVVLKSLRMLPPEARKKAEQLLREALED